MANTYHLDLPELTHREVNGELTHNESLWILDFFCQATVESMSLTTAPGSPDNGQAWIVAAGATGTWLNQDDYIAHYWNDAWHYYTPNEGWKIYNKADGSKYIWNNTDEVWVGHQTMMDTSPASATNVLTLDLQLGNSFSVTLTENVSTLTISNAPDDVYCELILILTQDALGPWTFAWPATTKWAAGTAPTITATASATDIFKLFTVDGGTTWYGAVQQLNLS